MANLITVALVIIALWLAFAGGVMAVRPGLALWVVSKAGSTPSLHWGEHILRFAAGALIFTASYDSRAPVTLAIIGGFIALSSVLILILPREWHAAYAQLCVRLIPKWMMRALSPIPVIAAGMLLWSVI